MRFRGRAVYGAGVVEGLLVALRSPVSFLGDVDGRRGVVKVGGVEVDIVGKVLAIPYSTGSTVGPYVMYQLSKYGRAPLAILSTRADTLLLIGSIMAKIPLVVDLPMEILNYGGCVVRVSLDEPAVYIPDECKAGHAASEGAGL